MKPFRWSPEKNEVLNAERGISFESVVVALQTGGLSDILAHPNQANPEAARSCCGMRLRVPGTVRRRERLFLPQDRHSESQGDGGLSESR